MRSTPSTSGLTPPNKGITSLSAPAGRGKSRHQGMKHLTWIIAGLTFILSTVYIARSFQWTEIAHIFARFRPGVFFIGGTLTLLCYWLVRTLRWSVILRHMDMDVRFLDLYLCSAVMLSFSVFTPVQSGELLKVELLHRFGMIERTSGYGSFAAERVMDLAVVCLMACGGIWFYGGVAVHYKTVLPILLVAGALISGGLVLTDRYLLKGRLALLYRTAKQAFISKAVFAKVALLTVLGWGLIALGWQISLSSLSIYPGFLRSAALTSIIALVNILSFIPGAVGVSEAGIAAMLLHFGETPSSSQAGALVIRSFSLLIALLGALHFVALLIRRKVKKRA